MLRIWGIDSKQLLSHINTMHSRSPDFRVVCGCLSEYRVYNSFYYHVKRPHAHHLLNIEAPEEQGSIRCGAGERTGTNEQTNTNPVPGADTALSSVTLANEGSSVILGTKESEEN
ncbi:hypothetical protein ATANTOWER_020424 [Ataeniobius toweri]|uniref:Fruitless n=1 Tax=Ataeniobius toweri TaxID=208326 RepID=A0ABU7ARL9_9TELE|nr:hypothetical protein [Ataeniobius toweri]